MFLYLIYGETQKGHFTGHSGTFCVPFGDILRVDGDILRVARFTRLGSICKRDILRVIRGHKIIPDLGLNIVLVLEHETGQTSRSMKRAGDGEKIIVWANTVAEARYSLSVPEQRLILWLAAQIEREDDALQERTVSILEMQEIIGGNNGRIYEQFDLVCDRLLTRVLELRDDEKCERVKFNWMHEVVYKDGLGCITLRFHDRLKPLLLNLKERFSMIPLKTVFKLRGGYAIRWYELLKAKEYLGTFSMSVEELRAWLAIDDGELSAVKDLRKRAIDVSKAELDNKADLTFSYTPTKVGKRITGWNFKVRKNHPRPVQRQLPLRDSEPERTAEEIARGRSMLKAISAQVAAVGTT